jgi:hypothetical protein
MPARRKMMIKQDSLNGALVFTDADKSWRLFDAIGDLVRKYVLTAGIPCDDTTLIPTEFVVTQTGTSPLTAGEVIGYPLLATTGATEYNGLNAQLKGETAKLVAGKTAFLRGKIKLSEATNLDFLFGLCELKTDLMKTSAAHGVLATNVEGVFFVKVAGATTLFLKVYKDGTEVFTLAVGAADTSDHDYELVWDGSAVCAYYDGSLIAKFAGTLPDGELTPSLNLRAGSAAARTASIAGLWYVSIG